MQKKQNPMVYAGFQQEILDVDPRRKDTQMSKFNGHSGMQFSDEISVQ